MMWKIAWICLSLSLLRKGNPQVIPSNRKTAKEGFPATLDCNIDSSISTTNAQFVWTKDGTVISPSAKTGISVLDGGKLYIKNCSRKDSGVYKCTARTLDPPEFSILSHPGQSVFLDVQFPPDIILIEDVASAAEGSDARLPCVSKANPGTVSTTWSRGGRELAKPKYEVLQEGALLVRSIKTSDAGTYTCTPSNSIGQGKSKSTRLVILPRITHVPPSVETVFIAKPGAPTIAMISRTDTTVTISWIPGYDIGPIQTFEVWYKKLSDTDSKWKTRYLPPSPTTYTLSDLEFGGKYWFAVRGLNKEAAGNFSRTVIYDTNGPQQVLYLLAPHVVSQHNPTNYLIPIVAGVLGSIIFVLLLCIACFCFKRYYGRKKPEDKVWRKFYFLRRDRKKRSKNDDKQIHQDVSEMEGDVPTARRQLEEQQEGSQSLHVDIENPSLKTSKDEDQIVSSGRVHADNQSNDESNEPKPDIVTNQGVVYIALDKDPPPDYQEVRVTYYREWRQ